MKYIVMLFLILYGCSISAYDITNAAGRWYVLTNSGTPHTITVEKSTNSNTISYAYEIILYDPLDHAIAIYYMAYTNRSLYKITMTTNIEKSSTEWYWYALAAAGGLIAGGVVGVVLAK